MNFLSGIIILQVGKMIKPKLENKYLVDDFVDEYLIYAMDKEQ